MTSTKLNGMRSYRVYTYAIHWDGSGWSPVEEAFVGDYIVKTTLSPEVLMGEQKVAGITLFPKPSDRIRFAKQVTIGRVVKDQ